MEKLEFQHARLHKLSHHLLQQAVKACLPNSTGEQSLDYNGLMNSRILFFKYPFTASVSLFPRQWKIDKKGNAYWIHDEEKETVSSALKFFGITCFMFYHLFVPGAQQVHLFGGEKLKKDSQTIDVAKNIRELSRFIQLQRN